MSDSLQRHLFPVVDALVSNCIKDLDEGEEVSCRKGCDYCCHLLVEIAWEEAQELALWLKKQEPAQREFFLSRVMTNAERAKGIFNEEEVSAVYAVPFEGEDEIPEHIYDKFFYRDRVSCPFLVKGSCAAYDSRPVSCRLHLVTSDSEICGFDVEDESDYEVPQGVQQMKEDIAPVLHAVQKDPRWGQMAIMVEAALEELENQSETPVIKSVA